MTEEEWLLHKNLLQWLHAQQRLLKIPNVFKVFDKDNYSKFLPNTVPGLQETSASLLKSHLTRLRVELQAQRKEHRSLPLLPRKQWEERSRVALSKATGELDSRITANPLCFTLDEDEIGISGAKQSGHSRRAQAPGSFTISPAYYRCVGENIYGRIPHDPKILFLHARKVGKYKEADAFKVRTYTFGSRVTMPEPKERDCYLMIQEGMWNLGDSLPRAYANLEVQIMKKVKERINGS